MVMRSPSRRRHRGPGGGSSRPGQVALSGRGGGRARRGSSCGGAQPLAACPQAGPRTRASADGQRR
eukprot:12333825-Alexandrium_andersonii.AAC.1